MIIYRYHRITCEVNGSHKNFLTISRYVVEWHRYFGTKRKVIFNRV